jgi:hypothetical protein
LARADSLRANTRLSGPVIAAGDLFNLVDATALILIAAVLTGAVTADVVAVIAGLRRFLAGTTCLACTPTISRDYGMWPRARESGHDAARERPQ